MTRKADPRHFIVRLNLSNPRHRQAWERLQTRGNASYTEAIVDALNQQADRAWVDDLRTELTQVVHTAIAEAVPAFPPATSADPMTVADPSDHSMSQANYAKAMAFMNGLM